MPIWDTTYLNRLLDDAEDYITASINCIFDRISIDITAGRSVYTLPAYVKNLVRITWKGKKLNPLTFPEFCAANPASAVVSETTKVESPSSIPHYYVLHPTNIHDIRFWPTPSENISVGTTDLFGSAISSYVIISCYRTQSTDQPYLYIPLYLKRRIKKAYLLSKAFAKEGKGQDLQAAMYYIKKLEYLITALKDINSNVFLGQLSTLNDTLNMSRFGTPARPVLPSEYGVVVE
jgi:hypothetical protein